VEEKPVPFNRDHMLLQWGGVFSPGAGQPVSDQFAGTIRFAGPGLDACDNDETCERVGDALRAWWVNANNFIPNQARLAWVKWNRITTEGKYASSNRTRLYVFDQQATTNNGARYPMQVAWTTSWRTDLERGRGSKGRTYWPTAVGLDPSLGMRVSPSNAATMAAASIELIQRLNVAANQGNGATVPWPGPGGGTVPGDPSALRASIMSDLGAGTQGIITTARVGNRLDIQRRRDNDVEEVYAEAAI
jgi:hypothetical protein